MWSLFELKNGEEKALEPLKFSNGKTQEDVVQEVIKSINQGYKTIFIKGVCGSGKSAIALNLAKEIGKASIVVPVKNLQKQYQDDYTEKKFLKKENGERLKIKIITGRQNFSCPFIKESQIEAREINSTLSGFQEKREVRKKADSCDNSILPCKIEIKEKNINIIKDYLKRNKKIRATDFLSLKHVKRMSIATICPYWSPIAPSSLALNLEDSNPAEYLGLKDIFFKIYHRRQGCGYYEQYKAYSDADVLIFNSLKYKLETVMNRKPATDIEIIDECDEFLDSFANYKIINLNRLYMALGSLFPGTRSQEAVERIAEIVRLLLKENINEEIISIQDTKILDILKEFLDSSIMEDVECDEENYCYHVDEVARSFQDYFQETYVTFEREDRDLIVKIITTDLEKRYKELEDKNKVLVLMSGTIHSPQVLQDVFGLNNFKIIEAETKMPGSISPMRTGLEIDCKYDNFKKGKVTREQYLKALQKCIIQAEKPALVHVNSFFDLPSKQEKEQFNLNMMTQEELREQQDKENVGEIIKHFKNKEIPILYSTKCNRGVDFPGDTCNSIILTKYPYPDVNSLFWRILKKTRPEYYNEFYVDKARRELLQKIYRGLRSENDHIFLLSPDIRVFQARLN